MTNREIKLFELLMYVACVAFHYVFLSSWLGLWGLPICFLLGYGIGSVSSWLRNR